MKLRSTEIELENEITIAGELIVGERLAEINGFSWTLASILGDMLLAVEEQMGPRDRSYTLLGIEFVDNFPRLWFPHPRGSKHIIIQLNKNCLKNMELACWQLAHECVHLLSPGLEGTGIVLEEGLAVLFQEEYMGYGQRGVERRNPNSPYYRAAKLTDELLSYDTSMVRRIRTAYPDFSTITADIVREYCPEVPEYLASAVTQKFVRGETF